MGKPLSLLLAFLIGFGTTVGLGLSTLTPANAIPWGNLLLNGAQVLQLSNLSTQQKVQLGDQIHQKVLSTYKLDTDPQTNAYVRRVGQRVAAASSCSKYPFHFYVVEDRSINAFSTTGGYVYANTGLLKVADNEDQLAAVMGHEIGHICNNDLINKMKKSGLAQSLAAAAGLDQSTVASFAYKLAFELPNSRQDEYKADAQGLKYIERAGYNPNAMPQFLSKLLNHSSPPSFLSDHPGAKERIAVLQKKIAAGQ
ncbi:M48 family metallopeptidase [Aetokthonos hydrillicola Thurmond2011]|jgi:predicted Zn-dependent protease|uniref:M48 family metallopeptidase n=1 Tax=Aetokthonos hydrillicola Thurmond2011 TaxID=2712845 RepID=A0AAP5I336_9CYAN|nr:M48 family metallopeptidase [Aetokthonos hydrillicola]MBO3458578.1 M48 family metalloprotease [Aetokthonos hydrillicola CCALA 1050]MBW4585021.1 M48 family metalloprotease [Aetokthonos hydrillicola CCALA 1050]MDR9894218.1 M48 family metallopeptidase [Aetokthonos hydrillicola Thurmond2011]